MTDPTNFDEVLREVLGPRAQDLSPDSRGVLRQLWERGVRQGAQQAGVLPFGTELLMNGASWAKTYLESQQECNQLKEAVPKPEPQAKSPAWADFHQKMRSFDEDLKARFGEPVVEYNYSQDGSGPQKGWKGLSEIQCKVAQKVGAPCQLWLWPLVEISLLRGFDAAHPHWDQIRLQGNDPLIAGYLFDVPVLGVPWLSHRIWALFLDETQSWKIGEHRLPNFPRIT